MQAQIAESELIPETMVKSKKRTKLEESLDDILRLACARAFAETEVGKKLESLGEIIEAKGRALSERTDGLADKVDEIIADCRRLTGETLRAVEREAQSALKNLVPVIHRHEISLADRVLPTNDRGNHVKYPLVLAGIAARVPLALVGPAGSGKTSMAETAARNLGLGFYPQSFCQQSSKSDLLGKRRADGQVDPTPFLRAFEHGGVYLADEFDTCDPGIAVILNSAIANGYITPENQHEIRAHEDFRVILGMNTYGTGADSQYVGRNRLDAATLDRFAMISIDYDDSINYAIAGLPYCGSNFDLQLGGRFENVEWLQVVKCARERARERGIKAIFSPRAIDYGLRLRDAGIGKTHVLDMVIYKGLSELDRESLGDLS